MPNKHDTALPVLYVRFVHGYRRPLSHVYFNQLLCWNTDGLIDFRQRFIYAESEKAGLCCYGCYGFITVYTQIRYDPFSDARWIPCGYGCLF